MALQGSGSITLNQINTELGKPSGSSISLGTASTGGYGTLSSYSPSKPDGTAPHRISEFFNYNHSASPPSITINSYNSGYLYFTVSETGYTPVTFHVQTSITSSTGPWTNNTAGVTSPRSVSVPTVTTWYRIQDASMPSIVSNVFQYLISDSTPPPAPIINGSFNNSLRKLVLSWTVVSDPSSPITYKIYSSNTLQATTTETTITLYGAYIYTGNNSWTVRASDAVGNTSGNSNAYTFKAS